MLNALLAWSMQIGLRYGVFSVGAIAFQALGAYAAALLTLRLKVPFPIALAGGCACAGLGAAVLLYPVHRLRGLYLAITTLALVIVVQTMLRALTITGASLGLFGIPLKTEFWHLLLAVLVVAVLLAMLERSRTGRALSAMGEDEVAATASGVNVGTYRSLAFVLSAVLAGLAGGFDAHLNSFIGPDSYGLPAVVAILSMVILGGLGRWQGPLLGAILMTLLPELLRPLAAWRDVISGAIIVLMIVYRPGGLIQLAEGFRWPRRRPTLTLDVSGNAQE